MTNILDARLRAVEGRLSPSTEPLTILRTVVNINCSQVEIQTLRDKKGNEWQRQPLETEQALIDRASLECVHNAYGVYLLIAQ